jgi:hypothetical protein
MDEITMRLLSSARLACGLLCASILAGVADSDVRLTDVPDYRWYAGCFGTATGNLMGYWDRHGLPDFYTGPTGGGLAPLNDSGANVGIRSMWASKAGVDGRPSEQPGHVDDYWELYLSDGPYSYESTATDPYITAGRAEHAPDCIGDFIGLSQKKWTNMNNECDGNVDAFSFVYWETNGNKRTNFVPTKAAGSPPRDIQSGLREWTKYRGYDAEVVTQLIDFNPETPSGRGFTFDDLKAEINAGYPLLVFLQDYTSKSRPLFPMQRANPEIHGMLIYGYLEYPEFDLNEVHCMTSWGYAAEYTWGPDPWLSGGGYNMSLRGVILFRPKPRIRSIQQNGAELLIAWDGPSSQLHDAAAQTTTTVHRYVVERTSSLSQPLWEQIGSSTTDRNMTISDASGSSGFFRVRLANQSD